jgi:hypothetical protein
VNSWSFLLLKPCHLSPTRTSEDCVYEDTLYPGAFRGREALKKHLLKVAAALPDSFAFVLDEVSDGGDSIGVQWHVESNGEPSLSSLHVRSSDGIADQAIF